MTLRPPTPTCSMHTLHSLQRRRAWRCSAPASQRLPARRRVQPGPRRGEPQAGGACAPRHRSSGNRPPPGGGPPPRQPASSSHRRLRRPPSRAIPLLPRPPGWPAPPPAAAQLAHPRSRQYTARLRAATQAHPPRTASCNTPRRAGLISTSKIRTRSSFVLRTLQS